jgi:hypothetical protein
MQEDLRKQSDNPCWKGYHPVGTKMKGGKKVPNCVPMNEGHDGEDHEVSMAHNALKDIISNASKLQNMLGQDEKDIPGWIQDHISQAQNFISQAATNYHELGSEQDCGCGCTKDCGEYDVEDEEDVRDFVAYMRENYSGLNESTIEEAEYQGRKVQLGKPTRGDVKKFKVYVKNPKGNVVKVNFGDPNMKIKKNIPSRRKSFRARHKCSTPGPRHKARYWSCRKW